MSKPLLVALTGGVGSGKSEVARVLRSHGASVVSGDELGRRAFHEFPYLLDDIRARFGDAVFHLDGTLDRKALGRRVFSDPANAKWLTDLTFPAIHRLWRQEVSQATTAVVVLDAALIFEWGIEGEFDLVVTVYVDPAVAQTRLERSGRLSTEEFRFRSAAQIAPELKAARAHMVLDNSGTDSDLAENVATLYRQTIIPRIKSGDEC